MNEVKSRILKRDGKRRDGRGFSREELRKVGLSLKDALRHRIQVDSRRATVHEENVEALKTLVQSIKATSKPKRKPKS